MKSRETIRQAGTSSPDTERGSYSPPTLEQMEPRLLLSAGLLGLGLTEPVINYNNTGTIVYDAASDALSVEATPLAIQLASAARPGLILTSAPSSFRIDALVDEFGDLIGGVSGDDLSVTGSVDFNRDLVPDLTGVLLTGEIIGFGSLDTGSNVDRFDFAFTVTGGLLASYYDGANLGVTMTSENSNFVGDFTVDFNGGAKGDLGAIPKPVTNPGDIDIEKFVMATVIPAGGEGFTPGYWKQSQHFDDWTGYSPGDKYNDVFGVDALCDSTLLGALKSGGGGVNALKRHSTAALLNAAHQGVDYQYTVGDVIAMVQQAFATGQYEKFKNIFAAQNELGGDFAGGGGGGTVVGYGDDADLAPGVEFADGQNITFTYVVTNNDLFELANVVVSDDNATPGDLGDDFNPAPVMDGGFNVGDTDGDNRLDAGEEWLYTASAIATVGQYTNIGTVVAVAVDDDGTPLGAEVTDSDPANYFVAPAPEPARISGSVYVDTDNDGTRDAGESGIRCVTIRLTGIDINGVTVNLTTKTDSDGNYAFENLLAGTYTVTETQPKKYSDGIDSVGSEGGLLGNDVLSEIDLLGGANAIDYNFGELKKEYNPCSWSDRGDKSDGKSDGKSGGGQKSGGGGGQKSGKCR